MSKAAARHSEQYIYPVVRIDNDVHFEHFLDIHNDEPISHEMTVRDSTAERQLSTN
jgi:hypothetical protein